MCPCIKTCPPHTTRPARTRRGLTLVELMISMAILAIMAGTVTLLSQGIELGWNYVQGAEDASQHGRVILARIRGKVEAATASESFPGLTAFDSSNPTSTYADTLVIWSPTGTAANATGTPLMSELIVYTPDATHPYQLLEITHRSDARNAPAYDDSATWLAEIDNLKTGTDPGIERKVLTELLSLAPINSTGGDVRYSQLDYSGTTSPSSVRGLIRFTLETHPTRANLAAYRASTLAWNALDWPLGLYATHSGIGHTWVRMELQLVGGTSSKQQADRQGAVPFFGSALVPFEVVK